jgi:hypothetical protein
MALRGQITSEETKKKISEAHKGKTLSKAHKEKLSKAHKGKTTWMKGKKHSEETKEKIRKAKKGIKNPEHSKRMKELWSKKIHPMKGKRHTKEALEKIKEARSKQDINGEKSYLWKGDKVGYAGLHSWIKKQKGKANKCENPNCLGKSKIFQWANISGEYKRDVNDFKMLCVSCHRKMDMEREVNLSRVKYIRSKNHF